MDHEIHILRLVLEGGPPLVAATADAVVKTVPVLVDGVERLVPVALNTTERLANVAVRVFPVAVQGYFIYQFVNGGALASVGQFFTSLGNCFISRLEFGSLRITLLVEDQKTRDKFLDPYNKGILIKRVNRAVQEYGSKFNDPQPEFTDLKLLSHQACTISEEDLQRIKEESKLLSSFIVEKGTITLDQKTSAPSDTPKKDNKIFIDQPSVAKSDIGSITLVGKSSAFSDKPAKDMDTDQQDYQKHQGQKHQGQLEVDSSLIEKYQKSPKDAALFAELFEASYETQQECAKYFPSEFNFKSKNFTKEAVQGVACILQHVKQMEELDLREKSLNPESIELILNAIKEGQIKMKKLNLSGNPISIDEAKSVSSIVEHVEELNLGDCKLSSESIAIICNAISEKKYKMKKLDLSDNTISNDEAESVSSIVEFIEELYLWYCKLTGKSIAIICDAISEKKCKMKKLGLCGNIISNDVAKSLSSIVEFVEVLNLERCSLSSESIAIICNAISEKKCMMKMLGLSGNTISNNVAKSLSSIFKFVEKLVLGACQIPEEGKEMIILKLMELGLPLRRVDFG